MSVSNTSSEELAARYCQLIDMGWDEFPGHEQELGDINDELWDRHGARAADKYIIQARQTQTLLTGG